MNTTIKDLKSLIIALKNDTLNSEDAIDTFIELFVSEKKEDAYFALKYILRASKKETINKVISKMEFERDFI